MKKFLPLIYYNNFVFYVTKTIKRNSFCEYITTLDTFFTKHSYNSVAFDEKLYNVFTGIQKQNYPNEFIFNRAFKEILV